MRSWFALAVVLGSACGDDSRVHHFGDAPPCTASPSPVEIVAPTAYACNEPFKSKVSITNTSCEPLTIQTVKLSAAVTSGQCGAAGPGMYPSRQMTLAPAETAVLLDLTAGPFCCTSPGCPATFQCDEAFTFMVVTNAGTFTKVVSSHLNLDGCGVICP